MSLGNTGLNNFKPKASSTAAQLIKAAPAQSGKKETTLQLRISSDVLLLFKEICEENGISMSTALRKYIADVSTSGFAALPLERAAQNCTDKMSVQTVNTTQYLAQGNAQSGSLCLRNDSERKAWLENFKAWGVWLDVPETNKKFYRYDFINGASLIVETGVEYWDYSITAEPQEWRMYVMIDDRKRLYDSHGESYTYVIQWLQKHAKEI